MGIRALMLAGALAAVPLGAQAPRNLTGHWILPEAVADTGSPPAPPAGAAAERPSPPPARGGLDRARAQVGLLLGMAGAVPSFTIQQNDTALVVTNRDGFSYALHPGGGEDRLTMLDSLVVRYRARWEGTFLEVEWRPEGGGKLVERYQLADSGAYLRLDVSVEFERFRRRESRLYRRADAP